MDVSTYSSRTGGRWSQSGFSSLCMAFTRSVRPAVLSVQTCCLLITSWLPGLQPSVTHAMFKGRKQGTPVRCRRFLASVSSFIGEESSRLGAPQQMFCWSQGSPCSQGDWENELLTFSGSRVGAGQEKGTAPAACLPCPPGIPAWAVAARREGGGRPSCVSRLYGLDRKSVV